MGLAIKLTGFLGILPRTAERLLPDMNAQEADNINMLSGEIRPVRPTSLVYVPPVVAQMFAAFRAEYGGAEKWRAWTLDVDVARGALPWNVEPRYYWTGDGEPKYSTFTNFGVTDLALGVPNPQGKPTVTPSGGALSNISRAYCYTFVTALAEESGPSPVSDIATGKPDGTWAIAGMDAFPANSGTGTAAFSAGVTTFTNSGNHWLRVGDPVVIGADTVPVTAIFSATVFKVAGNYAAATSWARKTPWNTAGMVRRLYRTAGTSADWQLVAEGVGTTYSDTLTDAQILGDSLITNGWRPPNAAMKGIITLPNGACVGFIGSELHYSEPNQPHSYPAAYVKQVESEIVGIASYGTTVVVATKTRAYVADGVDPSVVTVNSVGDVWPCLSKRSVVSVGDGVLFASTNGLAYIGVAGPSLWTKYHFTKEEWTPLNPSSMVCAVAQDRVFVLYTPVNGNTAMLVFSPGEPVSLIKYGLQANELYADPLNGKLYLIDKNANEFDAGTGSRMVFNWLSKEIELPNPTNFGVVLIEFESTMTAADQNAANASYAAALAANQAIIDGVANWHSTPPDVTHPFGLCLGEMGGCAYGEVPIGGSSIVPPDLPGDFLYYTLYDRKRAVSTQLIVSGKAARLPSGYKTDVVAHRLSGNVRVKSIKFAETMADLKQI